MMKYVSILLVLTTIVAASKWWKITVKAKNLLSLTFAAPIAHGTINLNHTKIGLKRFRL